MKQTKGLVTKLYVVKVLLLGTFVLSSIVVPLLSPFVPTASAENVPMNVVLENLKPEESARLKLMYQTMLMCMTKVKKFSTKNIEVKTEYGSDGLSDDDKKAASTGLLDLNAVLYSPSDTGWFKDASSSKIPQQIWKLYGNFSCSGGGSSFLKNFLEAFQIDYINAAPGSEFYTLVCGTDGKAGLFTGARTEELTFFYDGGFLGLGFGHKGDYGFRKRTKEDCAPIAQKVISNQPLSGSDANVSFDGRSETKYWKYGLMYVSNAEQYLIDWLANNRGITKATMFSFTDAELYWVYRNHIINVCSANQPAAGMMENNQTFSFWDVERDREVHYVNSYILPKDDYKGDLFLKNDSSYSRETQSCADVAKAIGTAETTYTAAAIAIIEQVNSKIDPEGQDPKKWRGVNCYLLNNAEEGDPIPKSCSFSELLAITKSTNLSDVDGVGPVCSIETIGWIICPVLNVLNGIAGALYGIIEDWLSVRTDVSSSLETQAAWAQIRNIANIGFVIMFLVVIVSQLTGLGISNYGLKKLLPKLIISILLINLSFIICQIAIDLSNILGVGIKGFLTNITTATVAPPVGSDGGSILGVILAGGISIAVIVAMGWQFIAMLIIVLLTMAVAIGLMFLVLLVRQVGIVILVVIAPVAVLCYLLPSTEKYAKMWMSWFTKLLILFPICSFLVGMGAMVSNIMRTVGNNDMMFGLIGGICLVFPYFLVFKTLKGAMNTFGNLSALPGKFGNKAKDSKMGRYFKDRHEQDKRNISLGSYQGKNPLNKIRSGMSGRKNKTLSRVPGVGGYYQNKMAAGASEIAKQNELEIGNEMERLKQSKGAGVDPVAAFVAGGAGSMAAFKKMTTNQQIAQIRYAATQGLPGREAARTMVDSISDPKAKSQIMNALVNNPDIAAAPDIGEWAKRGGDRQATFQSEIPKYSTEQLAGLKIDGVEQAGGAITKEMARTVLASKAAEGMAADARVKYEAIANAPDQTDPTRIDIQRPQAAPDGSSLGKAVADSPKQTSGSDVARFHNKDEVNDGLIDPEAYKK